MLFSVLALSVRTLPSVAITRPLQSSYRYMTFHLHAYSIRLALFPNPLHDLSLTRDLSVPEKFAQLLKVQTCRSP